MHEGSTNYSISNQILGFQPLYQLQRCFGDVGHSQENFEVHRVNRKVSSVYEIQKIPSVNITRRRPCIFQQRNNVGVNLNNLVNITLTKNSPKTKTSNLLHFTMLNARSLNNKAMFIKDYVVEHRVDCLTVTETWLNSNNESVYTINEVCPRGYAFMHIARSEGHGGGVGLLYKKYYKTEKQNVVQYSSFEFMEALIRSPSTVLRIGVVYRPPPSVENGLTVNMIFNEFADLLERLAVSSGKLLLLGDFNFHVDDLANPQTARFLDLLDCYNLKQHITGPSRKEITPWI